MIRRRYPSSPCDSLVASLDVHAWLPVHHVHHHARMLLQHQRRMGLLVLGMAAIELVLVARVLEHVQHPHSSPLHVVLVVLVAAPPPRHHCHQPGNVVSAA